MSCILLNHLSKTCLVTSALKIIEHLFISDSLHGNIVLYKPHVRQMFYLIKQSIVKHFINTPVYSVI